MLSPKLSFALLVISFTVISGDLNVEVELAQENEEVINLAVVACGDRVKETIVLLKSALMFTQTYLHFIIITEAELKQDFIQEVIVTCVVMVMSLKL